MVERVARRACALDGVHARTGAAAPEAKGAVSTARGHHQGLSQQHVPALEEDDALDRARVQLRGRGGSGVGWRQQLGLERGRL
eukprot:scaffold626_cov60-Phaeocystis_antarctica.AAC.12